MPLFVLTGLSQRFRIILFVTVHELRINIVNLVTIVNSLSI